MRKLKNKATRFLSLSIIFIIMISGLTPIQALANSEKTVSGSVERGNITVELTSEDAADTIIINLFPGELYFAEQFVGYNFVYPGLKFTGDFIITNNTGHTYRVTDVSFEAETAYIRRVYNDAAKSKYGNMSAATKNIVENLTGEEWYQLNVEYYGLENLYNIEVARQILGFGDPSQGLAVGVETSPELIALGEWYLFNKSQFSFDTDKYPIYNLNIKNIALQDYIDQTSANKDLVLNSCFSQEIGENGFSSTIGYSIDHSSVGNAYNGAYADFKFTLTLSRVITDEVSPPSPPPITASPSPAPSITPEPEVIDPDTPLGNPDDFNHIKYIYGYPDKSVRPGNSITRSETASIFFRLLTGSGKNNVYSSAFNDIASDSWYAQAVNCLAYIGVLTGYEDGTFRPDAFITRAEFAAIAARFDDLVTADETIFSDVPDHHWAIKYLNSAYQKGWINGYPDGTFKPEQNITRVEVVKLVNTMLNRLVKAEDLDDSLNPFNDLTRDDWGFAHILEASLDHLYVRDDDGAELWHQ